VIVDDFNGVRPGLRPAKANPPLVVDADTVLPLAVAFQGFKVIAGRDAQVFEASGGMHLVELARSQQGDLLRDAPDEPAVEDRLGILVFERYGS
jgi:hypothetical protein